MVVLIFASCRVSLSATKRSNSRKSRRNRRARARDVTNRPSLRITACCTLGCVRNGKIARLWEDMSRSVGGWSRFIVLLSCDSVGAVSSVLLLIWRPGMNGLTATSIIPTNDKVQSFPSTQAFVFRRGSRRCSCCLVRPFKRAASVLVTRKAKGDHSRSSLPSDVSSVSRGACAEAVIVSILCVTNLRVRHVRREGFFPR